MESRQSEEKEEMKLGLKKRVRRGEADSGEFLFLRILGLLPHFHGSPIIFGSLDLVM